MKLSTAKILEQLDMDIVQQEVHKTILPEYEYEGIAQRILLMADIFLEADLKSAKELLVEYSFDNVVRGIFDVVRVDHNDRTVIIDWKTTGNVDRPNYADEVRNENQTSFYLSYGGDDLVSRTGLPEPSYLEYRCVDEKPHYRTKKGEEYEAAPGHVLVFQELNGPGRAQEAMAQVEAVDEQYISQLGLPVWVRNKPKACFTGGWADKGPTCAFFEDCRNMTMPTGTGLLTPEELFDKRPRSKSSIKDFVDCPERFRRLRLLKEGALVQKPLPILKGEAFHAGIAEIYRQAWELKKENLLVLP